MNSEYQMARMGGMSKLEISVGDAFNRNQFGSSYSALTVIYYETIQAQPILNKCPTFSYPYPNGRQISLDAPGLADLEQPQKPNQQIPDVPAVRCESKRLVLFSPFLVF